MPETMPPEMGQREKSESAVRRCTAATERRGEGEEGEL